MPTKNKVINQMVKKAKKTKAAIKSLNEQMLLKLENFKSPNEVILFGRESLSIKGIRYHNCIPRPTFIISGLKIVAKPQHNNCFDRRAHCWVDLELILDIDYDSEESRRIHNAGSKPIWQCHFGRFRMTIAEHESKMYGIISNSSTSWDSEIVIEDFSKFKKIRRSLISFCEKSGFPPDTIKEIFSY